MILNLSAGAANEMLDGLAHRLAGGSIELVSDNGRTLAVLRLSSPACKPAAAGELEFHEIAAGTAVAQGTALLARVLAPDGSEALSVDVGDADSDAVMKFGSTQIRNGSSVKLRSFVLSLP